MTNNDDRREVRRARSLVGIVGFAGLLICNQRAIAATEFHPRTEVSLGWTDNVNLVPDDSPAKQSAFVGQLNPGFSWLQTGQQFNSDLDYTMQNVFYKDDSNRHSTFQTAVGRLGATLVSDWLYLNANGSYSQVLIDAHLPANYNNFFNVTNQTDALAIALTPSLRHDFRQVHFDASYSRGRVNYKGNTGTLVAPNDAETESRLALLRGVDFDAVVTWSGQYQSQRTRYDQGTYFRVDQANAELGMLLGHSLRLIGRGGRETDATKTVTEGGLDISTWEGGFRWQPSPRTDMEAFYGKQFYGPSYRATLQHTAKLVSWSLSYSDAALTQAQELIAGSAPGVPLGGAGPVPIPGSQGFVQLTSQIYIRRAAQANLHITGQRTDIELSASDYRRDFTDATLGSERQDRAMLSMNRRLAAPMKLTVSASADEIKLADGVDYHDTFLRLQLSRELGKNATLACYGFQTRRTGGGGYTARGVNLNLTGHY